MADITITALAAKAAPVAADELPIWDVAAGQTKKATITNIINARITGGGNIVTGGFTLTVPATGTAALLGTANVFTAGQQITPSSTSTNPLLIAMPAGATGTAIVIQENSLNAARLIARAGLAQFVMDAKDYGNNVGGPLVSVNRNTNAGTEGPAAGCLGVMQANGTARRIWADNSALLRIHSVQPTGSTGTPTTADTAGSVIGDQTSMAEAKHITPGLSELSEVIERIRLGAQAVRSFTYRSGAYDGQAFEGVVTDYAPAYGKDRDPEHPQGKSLNEISILADLLRVVEFLLR